MKDTQTDTIWDERSRMLRVVAHPVRLMILEALSEQPTCVKDLNSLVPIVQAHLSQHMAALRKAGLVDCHICGPLRCYYLVRPKLVKNLLHLLSEEHPIQLRSRDFVMRASRRTRKAQVDTK